MMVNVAAYTRNSIYEKMLLAALEKAKLEFTLRPGTTGTDAERDSDPEENGETGTEAEQDSDLKDRETGTEGENNG